MGPADGQRGFDGVQVGGAQVQFGAGRQFVQMIDRLAEV